MMATLRFFIELLWRRRDRSGLRFGFSAVAGIAGNAHLLIFAREERVHVVSHGDHPASDILLGIFIAREVALDVTEVALDSEADGEGSHDLRDLVAGSRFEDLEVL